MNKIKIKNIRYRRLMALIIFPVFILTASQFTCKKDVAADRSKMFSWTAQSVTAYRAIGGCKKDCVNSHIK